MTREASALGMLSEGEQRSVDSFLLLNRLERGLRNYIQSELVRLHGQGWERALPQDIKEKIQDRGLGYTDFPDLKKVLGANWRHLEAVRPTDKNRVLAYLEGLEPIRNDIAHSREVPEGAVAMLQAAFFVLSSFVRLPQAQTELPATNHPRVALDRVKAAIAHHAPISAADLQTLEREDELAEVSTAIAAYMRVRARPGRPLKLMKTVEDQALDAISRYLEETS